MKLRREGAVVIGASAGALDALSNILPKLPPDFGLPIFVVVHVPPNRKSALAELFRSKCRVPAREAEDKEPILPGCVYFAPPDYHLLVETDKSLALSSDEAVMFSRPSIDVLFESAAEVYGSSLIGIVLTGANGDGSLGLKSVVQAGGTAIVQNPDGAFAAAMPEAAIEACPNTGIMTLDAIAQYLRDL